MTKRVLTPVCAELAVMLAAANTACSNEPPAYSAAVVSSTTVQRLMPSSAVSRTISEVDRADAFQLIRRMSSPGAYSRKRVELAAGLSPRLHPQVLPEPARGADRRERQGDACAGR